jgi:hypothetical protein
VSPGRLGSAARRTAVFLCRRCKGYRPFRRDYAGNGGYHYVCGNCGAPLRGKCMSCYRYVPVTFRVGRGLKKHATYCPNCYGFVKVPKTLRLRLYIDPFRTEGRRLPVGEEVVL